MKALNAVTSCDAVQKLHMDFFNLNFDKDHLPASDVRVTCCAADGLHPVHTRVFQVQAYFYVTFLTGRPIDQNGTFLRNCTSLPLTGSDADFWLRVKLGIATYREVNSMFPGMGRAWIMFLDQMNQCMTDKAGGLMVPWDEFPQFPEEGYESASEDGVWDSTIDLDSDDGETSGCGSGGSFGAGGCGSYGGCGSSIGGSLSVYVGG